MLSAYQPRMWGIRMTPEEHANPISTNEWNPSEWDAVREDGSSEPSQEAVPESAHSQPPEEISADKFSMDLSCDPQAAEYLKQHGADTVENAFVLANILHTNKKVAEAAVAYKRAIDVHSKSPHQHPGVQVLLQVRLLCILKSGQPLPQDELQYLRSLNIPFANYIEGIALSWREGQHRTGLEKIASAYDEFHTGEEADWLCLGVARRVTPSLFEATRSEGEAAERIPRNIFMYWDQNPPEEIKRNFEYHSKIEGFNFKPFNKEEASNWLYEYYGTEARNIFHSLRHPAECADFLRVHITQLLGGWWLDADLRIKSADALNFMAQQDAQNVFFLTDNGVVHNDFYGTVANSAAMTDCLLSLYRNCYLFHHLYIAYKTGPGPFTRALNRVAHRAFSGIKVTETTRIYEQSDFLNVVEEFDTPYKTYLPHWQAV